MNVTKNASIARNSWIPYAGLLVIFWGIWGAFSNLPTSWYGYPDGMVYIIWTLTMLIPALIALRRQKWDRRWVAATYGLIIGLTGAGGQLVLFKALTMGPAYIIFPILGLSPAVTVLLALLVLRERLNRLTAIGVLLALAAIVLLSISSGEGKVSDDSYLILAIIVCIIWGLQAFLMRKAALVKVNDATTFGWMTISGLLLIPVAVAMMGGIPSGFDWRAPTLTAGTQVLNAVGALFFVMAISRGKASIVAPITNALAPVLTIVLSLLFLKTLPSGFQSVGIVLALVGSTMTVYADEKRAETPRE